MSESPSFFRYSIDKNVFLYILFIVCIKLAIWMFWTNVVVIGMLVSTFISFILLTLRHNHSHLPMFKNRLMNALLDFIFNIFGGFSSTSVNIIHNINHHSEIDSENDWGRTSRVSSSYEIINMIQYVFITLRDFTKAQSFYLKNRKELKKKLMVELVIIWSVYLGFFIFAPLRTLFYLGIPIVIAQLIVIFFNYIQHNNCTTHNKYSHSRNFTGRLLNTLTCNNGFHTVHHFYPSLHWSKYPQKHELIKNKIPAELNQNSVLKYIIKEIGWL